MVKRKRVLIVGSDSFIGTACVGALASRFDLWTTSRRGPRSQLAGNKLFFDLTQGSYDDLLATEPQAVLICAAQSSMSYCEQHPQQAYAANVEGTQALIGAFAGRGTHILFLSSNEVFAGDAPFARADSPRFPTSVYGKHKLIVENFLSAQIPEALVVRLTKVVHGGEGLWGDWYANLKAGRAIAPFEDRVIAPVAISLVQRVIGEAVERRLTGVLQVSGERDVSYASLARLLAARWSVPAELVHSGMAHATLPAALATRPYTTLDCERMSTELRLCPSPLSEIVDLIVAATDGLGPHP